MPRLIRIAIFAAAALSLSAGVVLLAREHPLWWVALLAILSLGSWILLERFARATERIRSRPDAFDRRRIEEEWTAMWKRVLLLPFLFASAFLLLNAARAMRGKPFFDLSSTSAFLETIGFPLLLPAALLIVFLNLGKHDPAPRNGGTRSRA